jgi:iron-sulfur cluster assembly accessory protein
MVTSELPLPSRKGKVLAKMTDVATHDHAHDHAPPMGSDEIPGAETMVLITPGAATKVNEIRQTEGIESNMALRLRVVGGGCAGFSYDLYFDEATEVDRQMDIAGVNVVVDEMSLMYLVGTQIDYVEGLQGAGFKFNNPNVKSTCGCGSSFSV